MSDSEVVTITDKIIDEETKLSFTVSAIDPDLPANALTYTASGLPTGATFDPNTGAFHWTPTEAQGPGSYEVVFTFTVTDDGSPALSDTETITITVHEVNRPPVLAPIGDKMVDEETPLTFTVSATDPDIPANTLTITAVGSSSVGATVSIINGTTIRYTLDENSNGTDSFTYTMFDDGTTNELSLSSTYERIDHWVIEWGDGSTETLPGNPSSVSHVFTDGLDHHSVVAAAVADGNVFNDDPLNAMVLNVDPILTIGGEIEADFGQPYTLNLASADPGDDTITHWTIDWDDGQPPEVIVGNPASVPHTFTATGTYTIQARAYDEDNAFQQGGFVENDGLVSIEVENYTGTAPGKKSAKNRTWNSVSDGGASGGTYLATAPNGNVNVKDTLDGPRLDFDVAFATTGTYYVWILMQGDNGQDDSVHFGLDGDPATFGNNGMTDNSGQWHWEQNVSGRPGTDRVSINVDTVGVHVLNLWMREDGTKVDKIVLSDDLNYTPTGFGPAETQANSGDGYLSNQHAVTVNGGPVVTVDGGTQRQIDEMTQLAFTVSGEDPGSPGAQITLSASNLPAGATFNPATGAFAWTPDESQGPDTYQVTFTAASTGAYYIGVSGYANTAYNPSAENSRISGSTGEYTLNLTADEVPGDTLATAKAVSLTPNVTNFQNAHVGDGQFGAKDVDMFRVELNAGQTLTLDIDTPVGTLDSYIRLFDNAGNQQDSNNDEAYGNTDSALMFNVGSTGTYYIGVSAFANTSYNPAVENSGSLGGTTGDYTLKLTTDDFSSDTVGDTLSTATYVYPYPEFPHQESANIGDSAYGTKWKARRDDPDARHRPKTPSSCWRRVGLAVGGWRRPSVMRHDVPHQPSLVSARPIAEWVRSQSAP